MDGELENNKRHVLAIRVLLLGRDRADIRVHLNGKPYVHWSGPIEDLSPEPSYSISGPASLGWASYQSELHFHVIQLKMLSGTAEPIK